MSILFTLHCVSTWALVGLIWTVQLAIYPGFSRVGRAEFRDFHARYTRGISLVVGPLMLTEILTAGALVAAGTQNLLFWSSLVPLAFNWLATWRVQLPLHARLAGGFDAGTASKLEQSNWWRTAAWSLRGVLLFVLQAGLMP